jgi:feruloyl esterase
VEQGIAPDSLIASKVIPVDGGPPKVMQRLVCAYPAVATYSGSGDPNAAASFRCVGPPAKK